MSDDKVEPNEAFVAIYHFSSKIISRSKGRSAVAAAAYRAGEKLKDERYDKVHDYRRKDDVVSHDILLPEEAPAWMREREKLWNQVESNEKRKDAQLAREIDFALPRELTLEQNIALSREFVQQEFVSRGMVADLCIHNDRQPDGEFHPHAHVMLTMREVKPMGFGQKVREWNSKETLYVWREAWAAHANRHLLEHGHDMRIDHRSLAEQQIPLEPQHKIGAKVAENVLLKLADHQRIARENGDKLLADPRIALEAITQQQSTFTHQDLARFVHRHTDQLAQFQQVYNRLLKHEQVVWLGQDDQWRDRFTTKEMLWIESQMVDRASVMALLPKHGVEESRQIAALDGRTLSSEQQAAFMHLVNEGDLKCLIGYAGTGKSYLLGACREAWEAEGYQVKGTALSGIAAENLELGSGIESRTIASRLHAWQKNEELLTARDVLVVDEAGMIGSRQLSQLLEEADRRGAKVVLIGDPWQLQAIDAGSAFLAVSDKTPTVWLEEVRRQKVPWQREATIEFATGEASKALSRYIDQGHVHRLETQVMAKQAMVDQWNTSHLEDTNRTQIMLASLKRDVQELNELARQKRHALKELGEDVVLSTARGDKPFAEHDRIYFLENDKLMGVKNGSLGTIERIDEKRLQVRLDAAEGETGKVVHVNLERYDNIDHGYAATVHKSQGVTVDRAYLLASKNMDTHGAYVGMTRHRERADVFYSRDEFVNDRDLSYVFSRDRQKDVSLDYSDKTLAREAEKSNNVGAAEISKDTQQISEQIKAEPAERWASEKQHTISVEKQPDPLRSLPHQHPVSVDKSELSRMAASPKEMRTQETMKRGVEEYDTLGQRQSLRIQERTAADLSHLNKQVDQTKNTPEKLPTREQYLSEQIAKRINTYERLMEKSNMPRTAKSELERLASNVSKKPEVMAHLKENDLAAFDKIQSYAKSYELSRDRGDRGRSL